MTAGLGGESGGPELSLLVQATAVQYVLYGSYLFYIYAYGLSIDRISPIFYHYLSYYSCIYRLYFIVVYIFLLGQSRSLTSITVDV